MLKTLERAITLLSSRPANLNNYWWTVNKPYLGRTHTLTIWYEPFMLYSQLFYIPFKIETGGSTYNRPCSQDQAVNQIFLCADASDPTIRAMITNVNAMLHIDELQEDRSILISYHDSSSGALHFERFNTPSYVPRRQPQLGDFDYM
jgi:hypothetical protein